MARVYCKQHKDRMPVMIPFHRNSLGQEYICAVCSAVRVFNTGQIVNIVSKGRYGFIKGEKENIFFSFRNLAIPFTPRIGMIVSYEIAFLDDPVKKYHAIDVSPAKGGINEN
ncbi:MAG: hypothetical protein J7M32_09205 [Deltaproteobacteria bacterium]|nr:hypothetical protein [Deltaproteobacteria bacterium]